jgi:argonaute siRNA chaperone (ARC) complex subunit Arb1
LAIQKYFGRKKLNQTQRLALDHFLYYGGVETRSRMFTNVDRKELKEMEKEEREIATATHFIDDEKRDESKWALDFLGVAEAYFGCYYPQIFDYTEEKLDLVCKVLENFYNYLLLHNVCSEEDVRQDISASRILVKTKVKQELLTIKELQRHLPGAFNQACNTLFNKNGLLIADEADKSHAKDLVAQTFKDCGNGKLAKFVQEPNWIDQVTILKEFNHSLQVTSVARPKSARGFNSPSTQTPLLGVLTCKPWENVKLEAADLPKGLVLDQVLTKPISLWFEDSVLEHCYPGMKLGTDLRLLDLGGRAQLWTIGNEIIPLCSFYRYILNELDVKPLVPFDQEAEADAIAEKSGGKLNLGTDVGVNGVSGGLNYEADEWESQNTGNVIQEDD